MHHDCHDITLVVTSSFKYILVESSGVAFLLVFLYWGEIFSNSDMIRILLCSIRTKEHRCHIAYNIPDEIEVDVIRRYTLPNEST